MIRLYDANETQFNHEETVLTAINCTVYEDENGAFLLSMETPIDERVQVGKIVKASTPRGDQLFRIKSVKKKLDRRKQFYEISGEHIFYDLRDNLILNIRPTDTTAINALNAILDGTEYSHRFTGTSDVQGLNTANYVRLNPIQAIMGNQPNALVNLWGGYLKRDNFEIAIKQVPLDRGYEVRLGKNLIGVEQSIDLSQVVTRIYPTVVIEGNVVTDLPEKYVDSPLIGHYPAPLIRELRINLTDEEKLLPVAQIYQLMRERSQAHFDADADKPLVNYNVNFVQLGKTEEYKDLAILEDLDLSDMVHVAVEDLGILVDARVIKYTWDSLEQRFLSIELGNFKQNLTSQTQKIIELIEKVGDEITDGKIAAALKAAIERITGHRGGYRYDLFNPDGQPSGTVYMDTDDVNTAQNYILINNQGIAFGDSGLSNPPTLAISIDGTIAGDGAFFNSIVTNLIQSDIGQRLDLSSNESIGLIVTSEVAEQLSDPAIQEQFKGEPGADGKSVGTVTAHYYLSTSPSVLSGGSWSTTYPGWESGKYLWTKTVTTYSDDTESETTPINVTGMTGSDGRGIQDAYPQWYLSTSRTSQAGGSWQNTMPTWLEGRYMWTRMAIVLTNPTEKKYTDPTLHTELEEIHSRITTHQAEIAVNKTNITSLVSKTESIETDLGSQITELSNTVTQNHSSTTENYGRLVTRITETETEIEDINSYIQRGVDDDMNPQIIMGRSDQDKRWVWNYESGMYIEDGGVVTFEASDQQVKTTRLVVLQSAEVGNHVAQKYGDKYTIWSPSGG